MASVVTIPDFDFSGFYYPQLLERLIRYKRLNVPELTDESDYEPFIQLIRMIALVGHQNNVLLDLVANESTLPTAKLSETVRNMLRLIDYRLRSASPAGVDIVYELSKVFTSSFQLISPNAQAATAKDGDNPVIYFEANEPLTIERTDQLAKVFAQEASVFSDYTTQANAGTPWSPWASPDVGDEVYFGHGQVMWDELAIAVPTPAANIEGVWEYYDGNFRKSVPTGVTNTGIALEFDLTSYLGINNRSGTKIRVELASSTSYEDVTSTWDGVKNIATTGFLGQSTPSTDPANYIIGSDWEACDAEDDTQALTQAGSVQGTLPQSVTRNWALGLVNGVEAYWQRFRVTQVSTPTAPALGLCRIDTGKQYALRPATQGQTAVESPLGSSNGLPDQRFKTAKDGFLDGSDAVTVDSAAWTRVDNFLASNPTDQHYVIELGENDRASVVFGNGTNGRIPPTGVGNIAISYRYGASDDGNVGAETVTVDKTSLTYISRLFNPRPATGWEEAQGNSDASLERAKIEGVASLRTRGVAVSGYDVEQLAKAFVDDNGSQPFARATVFEGGFGPKTIELVVCAHSGNLATNDQLEAVMEWFNGDKTSSPPKPKRLVANQEVVAVNYTPRDIDVTAVVSGSANLQIIKEKMTQVLQPDAVKDDGVSFQWEFGATVPVSRLIHEIFAADSGVTAVTLSTPASDVTLLPRELPRAGTITLTEA